MQDLKTNASIGVPIWVLALASTGWAASAVDATPSNVSNYLGDNRWSWTVFITGSNQMLGAVRYVEYTLHPTFPNPVRRVDRTTDPRYPFGLTATGWGTFEVGIKVVFKDGRTQLLKHTLRFDAVPAASTCGASFRLLNRHYQRLNDARIKDPVYLYVDEIHTEWTKNPFQLTVFFGDPSAWGTPQSSSPTGQALSESKFSSRIKNVRFEARWSVTVRKEGESLQFRDRGTYYVLNVRNVNVHLDEGNYLDLQVCEKQ